MELMQNKILKLSDAKFGDVISWSSDTSKYGQNLSYISFSQTSRNFLKFSFNFDI